MNMKTGYRNMVMQEGEMTTCILNEGILNFDEKTNSFSLESEIGIDDVVELDMKTDNTYDQYYIPFVRKYKQPSTFDVGIVISEPLWQCLPQEPKTIRDWAEIRKNHYYRLAVVYLLRPIAMINNRYLLSSRILRKNEKDFKEKKGMKKEDE